MPNPKHVAKHDRYPADDGSIHWMATCLCGFNRVGILDEETARYCAESHWKPNFQDPMGTDLVANEILWTSKGEEIEVQMTEDEAFETLQALQIRNNGRPNEFVESLCDAYVKYGSWTDGQRPWVHKLANEAEAPKSEPRAPTYLFPNIVAMMHEAAEHLKYPRMVVEIDGNSIRLSVAGVNSRRPGTVNVTSDGTFEERDWYGRIDLEGGWEPARRTEKWVTEALREIERDPAGAARVQGQRYGRCCFCRQELTTKESVSVGYGPICAGHYGLPWGHVD